MIAPTGRDRKTSIVPEWNLIPGENIQLSRAKCPELASGTTCSAVASPRRHSNVSQIIMLPNFRQADAVLGCEKEILRWPGSFDSGFLSPQPPGVDGTGPVRRKLIPTLRANASWSFFFLGSAF
jgi:hypothetical protein